ncbi:hypothetical protein K435DRAFT_854037 [Dendrothele bispora CBS 962.96]|uniref:Glycoside hydrolase family 76 protein n=1 Tax=Dendrothele bispora (strain CBS 962.96) TaxID=1314807 RepID=A0A4S8MFE6_DENBC|nr:hypothetical protein K435DRAFT_854037 [Dendrothele bispora CBS 962.96]
MSSYKPILWALFVLNTAWAQDFAPSSSWRKPNVVISPANRISIASAALEEALSQIGPSGQFDGLSYGTAGSIYAQMAEFDLLTNQTRYKEQLKGYFRLAENSRPNFSDQFVSFIAIPYWFIMLKLYTYYDSWFSDSRAYVAYQDEDFLNFAAVAWNSARQYTLSEEDVQSGTIAGKNFSISSNCQGITMAGGSFSTTDESSPDLDGPATGNFLVLSALLAETTSNQTYLHAATQSKDFIHAHLYNVQNIVQHTISANREDSCKTKDQQINSWDSGLMIEGLAVLASVTQEESTKQLRDATVFSAVNNSEWQGLDGVIANGDGKTGDRFIVRGLAAAYNRSSAPSDLRNYLKSYLGVQYNAVLDLASMGTNIYGNLWLGPAASQFNADNQTDALGALLAAIPLRNDSQSSPSPSPTMSPLSTPNPQSHSKATIIVASVLGSLAFFSLTAFFSWFLLRCRRRKRRTFKRDSSAYEGQLSPYTVAPSSSSLSSEARHGPKGVLPSVMASQKYRHRQGSRTTESHANPRLSMLQRSETSQSLSPSALTPTEVYPSRSNAARGPIAGLFGGRNEMSVAELVSMLNERLQPGHWHEDEMPPEYREEIQSQPGGRR